MAELQGDAVTACSFNSPLSQPPDPVDGVKLSGNIGLQLVVRAQPVDVTQANAV
ncbi:MAG: hypothetical protein H7Y28_15875 [Rhodoferax sp.]|nr:hypothetical protein [Rhodoferax sp.]